MKESLDNLKNELKRVDHLIYVSLKYTRTVDVLKNTIERMISAFDFGMDALFAKIKRRRKNLEVPIQQRKKCELLREIFPDDEKLNKFLDFYLILRDLSQSKYKRREEFRRHVTMISEVKMDDKIIEILNLRDMQPDSANSEKAFKITETVEINIDILSEFYEKMKEFVDYVEGVLNI